MSAINEIKSKGNAYRICIDDSDPTNLKWERESFWTAASDVEFEDGMTAEQKIDEINANVQEKFNQLFQSASDGKSLIASTITGLGVNTASDATYQVMSNNIKILATNKYNEGYNVGYNTGYNIGYNDGYQVAEFGDIKSSQKNYLNVFTYYHDSKYFDNNNTAWITCDPNSIKQISYIAITGWQIVNTQEPYGNFSISTGNDNNGIYINSTFTFAHQEGLDNTDANAYVLFRGFFVYK